MRNLGEMVTDILCCQTDLQRLGFLALPKWDAFITVILSQISMALVANVENSCCQKNKMINILNSVTNKI